MLRVGSRPIEIPKEVKIQLNKDCVIVEGPLGKIVQKIPYPDSIEVIYEGNQLRLQCKNTLKQTKAIHGTLRQLINNAVVGVKSGFERTLICKGLGYKVKLQDNKLYLEVGYSHPVIFTPPVGIKLEVSGDRIKVFGVDKQLVGQVAAQIRSIRPPDSYKAYGIKFEDERIVTKATKAVKKGK